ncbi:SGNH/GDSL hydrolase family protein [Winogradskyella helgolandensis]|uniref:SGNH/GDSL hydrolase family protein n=1 Tax=Winogradskyella helgolandensis TaxID=2697010 RepID=UPI0015BD5CD3|nr:SGNH/GDSL hydrolase family protein [Winogradskyella helgolandensis]
MFKIGLSFIILIMLFSCEEAKLEMLKFQTSNDLFKYSGRHEIVADDAIGLIGSAASVEFNVKGDSINLYLQTESTNRNYYVITVNDVYNNRYTIEGDSIQQIALKLPNPEQNKIGIYKATEAYMDKIIFHGIDAEALLPVEEKSFEIEFIGDSITCGALCDDSGIPCNEGDYQDQHNAYLAYGPQLALQLNARFLVSSVSGIGMYRNWNDENSEEAIMPDVYGNLYLNKDNSKPFNLDFKPDVVSICLGTNDLSDGDGVKERLPFNAETYISNYIKFVETIYKRYPETKVALLSSPMFIGEKQRLLVTCLKQVQIHFKTQSDKDIALFQFEHIYSNGCNAHPSAEEQKTMANALEPFFKSLLTI